MMDKVEQNHEMSNLKNENSWTALIKKLSKEDLKTLEETFKRKYEKNNKEIGLNKDEFCDAFNNVSDSVEYEETVSLFTQFKTQLVTWTQFLDFLLDNMNTSTDPKLSMSLSSIVPVVHTNKESVVKIVVIETEKYFCYAIILKHGRVGIYNGNMDFLTCYHVIMTREDIWRSDEERRRRNRWVTDAIFCRDVQMFVVTNTARSIMIYEASGLNHVPFWLILTTPNVIECLSYKSNPSILFAGDNHGQVTSFTFLKPNVGFLRKKHNDKTSLFYWTELQNETEYVTIKTYKNVHKNSVQRIEYFSSNDCLVTCSQDLEVSLIIKYFDGKKKSTVFKMDKGTSCFDLSFRQNILITGSNNGVIRLWNPVVVSNPIGTLNGHQESIVDLQIMENQLLFFSCSRKGIFKLWDISEQQCLQVIEMNFPSFEIYGKEIEWGIKCIYPGPKRKNTEKFGKKVTEIGHCFGLDDVETNLVHKTNIPEELNVWERSHIFVTCCNYIAKINLIFHNPDIEASFFEPILPHPPLQNTVLIPNTWRLRSDSTVLENGPQRDPIEINMEKHLNDIDFILKSNLNEEFGLKSDINYKIAVVESKKRQMQELVSQGTPYLALDLYDIQEIKLSDNLPVTNSGSIKKIVEKTMKLLDDASARDQIFSEPPTSRSSRSSRSSIVEQSY